MITLTVTSMTRRRFEVTRPDRRDTVIVRASNPVQAALIAAEEWGLDPNGYIYITATNDQEQPT